MQTSVAETAGDKPLAPSESSAAQRASWIDWVPGLKTLRTYEIGWLRNDVVAGIVLSTMLHGIGVGNMLPSWVKVVCVDINPSVVTKLVDRGSAQTLGLVTDTGLFVHQLAEKLGRTP